MNFFSLAFKSIFYKRFLFLLTLSSLALSFFLIFGIERAQHHIKSSFENTISGSDLIVGARGGPLQLLLYSVFGIGSPSNNIRWSSFEEISADADVQWAFPISLGDSHRGYRVVGTQKSFFDHYRYSNQRALSFREGTNFAKLFEVVIGSDIAEKLSYSVGTKITLSHGTGKLSSFEHEDHPFKIVGVLKRTGTPVDRSLYISLEAMEAIHEGWEGGYPSSEAKHPDEIDISQLKPYAISAFFLSLKSKAAVFSMQRDINEYEDEALSSILPGVTLQKMWRSFSSFETALKVLSLFVLLGSLLNIFLVLLLSVEQKSREMSVYRALGAGRVFVYKILCFENIFLVLSALFLAWGSLEIFFFALRSFFIEKVGFEISSFAWTKNEICFAFGALLVTFLISLIPTWYIHKRSLIKGL